MPPPPPSCCAVEPTLVPCVCVACQLDATRRRAALLIDRGAAPSSVLGMGGPDGAAGSGVDSGGSSSGDSGAWMRFFAPPALAAALTRRYPKGDDGAGGGGGTDATSGTAVTPYYFDFASGDVTLELPVGAVIIPKPPTEAYVRSQVGVRVRTRERCCSHC